jgi:uncharacterized protein (TIGR00251 family)
MRVSVKVQPRASKEEVVANSDKTLKVYMKEAPTDGKANKALMEVLAEYYNVKKSDIKIVNGLTSRKKIIEIASSPNMQIKGSSQ